MKTKKKIRAKGKKSLSKYFYEYKPGEKVALVLDISEPKGKFSKRFHGKTGTIERKQGRAYVVKFLNGKVLKKIITTPEHLKPIKAKRK
ncbi:MAG: 50S ribosomal protein L21e [Candidatus Pacearchaeota archaeon]|nr:50S ribosomal protein L21e [Candidatus Pacearchaeota archaeon]